MDTRFNKSFDSKGIQKEPKAPVFFQEGGSSAVKLRVTKTFFQNVWQCCASCPPVLGQRRPLDSPHFPEAFARDVWLTVSPISGLSAGSTLAAGLLVNCAAGKTTLA